MRIKIFLLFGDIATFYVSLFAMLFMRYGTLHGVLKEHFIPFVFILLVWFVLFFIGRLYEQAFFRNNKDFFNNYIAAYLVALVFSIIFFYAVPFFRITPKINLVIFGALFFILNFSWRYWFNRSLVLGGPPQRVIFLGKRSTADMLRIDIENNFYLGVEFADWWGENFEDKIASISNLHENMFLVADADFYTPEYAKKILGRFGPTAKFISLAQFHEKFFEKIPDTAISEFWVLTSITAEKWTFDAVKRLIDFMGALVLGVVFFPLIFFIALLVFIFSRGPIFFYQERVGYKGRKFTLVKFRNMKPAPVEDGRWANADQNRITAIGKLLRRSHLDELPQLWNILKGDMSFVGPRPEQVPLAQTMRDAVPFYDLRHLVKPGLTGWAQLKYKYGGSVEQNRHKLEYDLYYVKNRSLALDLVILLKTARMLLWTGL